jgi:hypothetical protein
MRPDIHGGVKTRVIVAKGIGFHSTRKGKRKRKTMRGNVITEETFQINMKLTENPEETKERVKAKKNENQTSSRGTKRRPRKRAEPSTTKDQVQNS